MSVVNHLAAILSLLSDGRRVHSQEAEKLLEEQLQVLQRMEDHLEPVGEHYSEERAWAATVERERDGP